MARYSFKDSPLMDSFASLFLFAIAVCAGIASGNKEGYYGKYLGKLSQLHHGVSGDVFAVDARTLHLRNFNYDGEGPAAYFYAGNTKVPGAGGFRLRDERGTTNVLPRYRNKHLTITLPEGKTLHNIRWFSVWCDEFSVNFGDVKIPKNLDFPKPQKINGLSGVHGVSSEPIVIVDAQTLLIPSFSYDGEAPDAKFWVGRGFKPSPQGIRIPDENGKEVPLRRYDRKTIVLTLPGDLTIFDIGHFGVWCEAFTVDFGHVQIPRGLNIPPSLKMLGVSPQKRSPPIALPLTTVQNGFENQFGGHQTGQPRSKLNCEVLWDDFAYEVRWAVAGDSIVLQLVARLENNEYMSFGLSGDNSRSRMVGGDVVVAWVDKETFKGYAQDYYLDAKSQCSGGRGSCPDENIVPGTDSVRLLNAALVNGYSIVTFQRSLKAGDELDKPVFTNQSQPIIWAVGPLNSRKEVSYHSLANRGDIFIDFGRSPKWNCPTPESVSDQSEESSVPQRETEEARIPDRSQDVRRDSRPKTQVPTPAPAPKSNAWEIPSIKCYEPEDGVFYAQMGPTGGKHGYSAITGHVGWGISWYINGLLIPEINVVRGRTYTFIVEGGLDPETPARYHPFYITDDPVGGYQHKTPEERANIQIFAGAVQNKRGEVRPTGVGRLCNWTPDPNQPPADEFTSFGAYQRTLRLECDPGNPGIIQWTVEKDTPDTVYYQCYTHRYLGWKINVHDRCEGEAASDPVPSIVKAPADIFDSHEADSEGSESVNYEARVKPNYGFVKNQTVGVNEFVKHDTIFRYQPEFYTKGAASEEITLSKNPFVNHQVIESLKSQIPQTLIYPVRPEYAQVEMVIGPHVPQLLQIPDSVNIPKAGPTSGLYSVTEEAAEGDGPQNFQIIPVSLPKPTNHQLQEVVQTVFIPNNKFAGEFPKNHHILRAQAEEKFKKHNQKPHHFSKPTNRLPPPANRLRKPPPPLALHQRPFPPAAFRPPHPAKAQKRPPPLQKIPLHFHHPHHRLNGHGPEDLHKGQHAKKPQEGLYLQQSSDLVGASNQQTLKNIPFAHNTGFDPDSVQVEGGFKPILNTGIAPKSTLIDRADTDVEEEEEETDRKTGTVDLRVTDGREEPGIKEVDLFKHLKPQTFEPVFVPSFPDDSFKKRKKKPIPSLKNGNDQFQYNGQRKGGHVYVKMRPNANLVPRPLYPDSVVPPFKIPYQGRTPQFRNQDPEQVEDEEEDAAAEVEKVNETLTRAGNILEVMEMEDERENKTGAHDEIAMADERKDFYLSPKPEQFRAYDGRVVNADLAPALPARGGPPADLSKLPQFVPFRGVMPPLTQTVNTKNLPQLRTSKLARHDILPPSKSGSPEAVYSKDSLNSQGSRQRKRRSPDHVPGHVGHDHHDHHDHHHPNGSSASASNLFLVTVLSFASLFAPL